MAGCVRSPRRVSSFAPEQTPPDSLKRFIALASFALVITILWVGRGVIVPIVFAALLAFLLSPAVGRLMRWGLNKFAAIAIVLAMMCTILTALGWMVGLQVLNLAEELPAYERNIQEKIVALKSPGSPSSLTRTTEMVKKILKDVTQTESPDAVSPTGNAEPTPVPVRMTEEEPTSFEVLGSMTRSVLGLLGTTGIVIVLFVAMLIGREDLRDRFIKVVSAGQLNLATQALDDASRRVSRYLLMQLLVNATYGIPVGLGLYFIGIPNAPLWGLLATLLRFIPFLGPWIAALFPMVLAVAVDPGWTMIFQTLALFLVMELVSNNIIEVWLYGAGTGISNLALLVAAVFWTSLWGPMGLVLSTPLTVCLLVLGKYVPGMRFLSTLLGSEPVLDPPAQLYQRMLSRDSDEMLQVATEFIEHRSLASFYDEMFLPALLMAEQDRHSGALAEMRQQFIFRASRELIEELARRTEAEHEASADDKEETTVVTPAVLWGVPASDDADELVCLMAQHLLHEHGFRTVVSPVAASPEEQEAVLHRERVQVAFVSALPPSALSSAHRACRRLKEASPNLPVIVGVWTPNATTQELLNRLRHAKPDAVVMKLGHLVTEIEQLIAKQTQAAPETAGQATEVPTPAAAEIQERPLGLRGSEPEAWIERVTRASAQLFDVPVSLVSVVAADELFWPARLGLSTDDESDHKPALRAFLNDAAGTDDLLVVDDVAKDKRLAPKTFVRERGVRRLVDLVLRTESGRVVGHLCLVDTNPQPTTDEQRQQIAWFGKELVEAVADLNATNEATPQPTL